MIGSKKIAKFSQPLKLNLKKKFQRNFQRQKACWNFFLRSAKHLHFRLKYLTSNFQKIFSSSVFRLSSSGVCIPIFRTSKFSVRHTTHTLISLFLFSSSLVILTYMISSKCLAFFSHTISLLPMRNSYLFKCLCLLATIYLPFIWNLSYSTQEKKIRKAVSNVHYPMNSDINQEPSIVTTRNTTTDDYFDSDRYTHYSHYYLQLREKRNLIGSRSHYYSLSSLLFCIRRYKYG